MCGQNRNCIALSRLCIVDNQGWTTSLSCFYCYAHQTSCTARTFLLFIYEDVENIWQNFESVENVWSSNIVKFEFGLCHSPSIGCVLFECQTRSGRSFCLRPAKKNGQIGSDWVWPVKNNPLCCCIDVTGAKWHSGDSEDRLLGRWLLHLH